MNEPTPVHKLIADVPGIVALVGGGGKSTFLHVAGHSLAQAGKRVILATTTHMRADQSVSLIEDVGNAKETLHRAAAALDAASSARRPAIICVGAVEAHTGKLTAPSCSMDELARICDFVLVEADGSRNLPFKAHNVTEPVIPPAAGTVIYLVGASGFNLPIHTVVHRPALFCQKIGCSPYDAATPKLIAQGIRTEGLLERRSDAPATVPDSNVSAQGKTAVLASKDARRAIVVVNQAEDPTRFAQARELARELPYPVFAGSVRDDHLIPLFCRP